MPLWSPITKGEIQRLEEIQQSFIRKIAGVNRNYSEALKQLQLYSLERRRDRYTAVLIWKILEHKMPNLNDHLDSSIQIESKTEHRLGRTCKLVQLASCPGYLQSVRKQSLKCNGPKVFNSLPKEIRNLTGVTLEQFKLRLDSFLKLVPDEPFMRSSNVGRRQNSNSVWEMVNLAKQDFCLQASLQPVASGREASDGCSSR